MSLYKKIALITLLLVAAVIIGYGIYYFFSKTPFGQTIFGTKPTTSTPGTLPDTPIRTSTIPSTQIPTTTPGTLPGGVTSPTYYQPRAVTQVTSDPALFTSVNDTGAMRYYNALDGKFYRINPDGTIKQMSDQIFFNAEQVTWAKTTDKAVVQLPDGTKVVYNFDTKKQTTLPKHWEDFSFSQDGSQIASKSLTLSPESRWLITSKDDGSEVKYLEHLGDYADRVNVDWSPSRQVVAFSQTGEPIGMDRREVLLLGTQGENFKSLIIEGLDFSSQWSPSGKNLLYSVDSARTDFKPELWIVNAYGDEIGNNRTSLKLNTWSNKCTFADDTTLFCAVPRDLPSGAGISPEIAAGSYDDVFKIDLRTGAKVPVPLGENEHRIKNVSYDKQKNSLFFTDSVEQGVFEIKL